MLRGAWEGSSERGPDPADSPFYPVGFIARERARLRPVGAGIDSGILV